MVNPTQAYNPHLWNDWMTLGGLISYRFNILPERGATWAEEDGLTIEEEIAKAEDENRADCRKQFERNGYIVQQPSHRYRNFIKELFGQEAEFTSLTPQQEEQATTYLTTTAKQQGSMDFRPPKWDLERRLNELGQQCNDSLRKTAYESAPFEYELLLKNALEASVIITGEPTEYLASIQIPTKNQNL